MANGSSCYSLGAATRHARARGACAHPRAVRGRYGARREGNGMAAATQRLRACVRMCVCARACACACVSGKHGSACACVRACACACISYTPGCRYDGRVVREGVWGGGGPYGHCCCGARILPAVGALFEVVRRRPTSGGEPLTNRR